MEVRDQIVVPTAVTELSAAQMELETRIVVLMEVRDLIVVPTVVTDRFAA